MRVLVIGGTGTVGSEVVREALGRKLDVAVLTRSPDKAGALPAGVRGVTGDLVDPGTVRSIFRDVDGVFLVNAMGPAEAQEGLMAVCGARLAGVKRLVYLSVLQADRAPYLPHFGAKIAVETAVKAAGIPYTILRPANFFQNDYWVKDALLGFGIYPQPLGDRGVARVDVRDIAEAAVAALTSPGHDGLSYDLLDGAAHTGQSTAEAWSRALGTRITYGGNDLDAWEQQAGQTMPGWLAFDARLMFAFFQQEGLVASSGALERQARLIGRGPRRFEDFAAETAAQWKRTP